LGGGGENGLVVVLQNLHPACNIAGVIVTLGEGDLEVGTKESSPQLGNQLFLRIASIAKTLAAKVSERRRKAGVPEEVAFATKPAMASKMIAAALDGGISCAWVLADAVYGSDYKLRRMLEDRGQPYVLAVRSNQHLRFLTHEGLVQTDPAYLAEELEADDWHALSAGGPESDKRIKLSPLSTTAKRGSK